MAVGKPDLRANDGGLEAGQLVQSHEEPNRKRVS